MMKPGDLPFSEFYAAYLAEHRQPGNRALHLLAKLLAVASLVAAAHERSVLLVLAAPVLAVGPCWLGHLWFEGNRPVSWESPAASLLGTLGTWAGRLAPRRRAGSIAPPSSPASDRGPTASRAGLPAGGRAYYSLLADLRMCGEMLVPWRKTAGSPDASRRT
jgi:hypothetical protein